MTHHQLMMAYTKSAIQSRAAENRIPVLRLELDYELQTLFDAMQANDLEQIEKSKAKLQELRRESLLLEM